MAWLQQQPTRERPDGHSLWKRMEAGVGKGVRDQPITNDWHERLRLVPPPADDYCTTRQSRLPRCGLHSSLQGHNDKAAFQ